MLTRRLLVRSLVATVLVAFAGCAALVLPRRPAADRNWAPDHRRLARATFRGDSVFVRDVRNFRHRSESDFREAYYDRGYDLRELTSVWFIVTPFHTSFRGPAHTFLSFGFRDSSYVSISVEARREVGETYGFVSGLLRRFEVIYIVGDERDLIARRSLFDEGAAYLYPINTSDENRRRLFVEMLERANALQDRPEFYNTLTSNCTSNVIDHVNRIVPGRVPSTIKTILPGYSDEVALSLGLIDDTGSMDALRERYRINARAAAGPVDEGFSRRLRSP